MISGKNYNRTSFPRNSAPEGEYDSCTFDGCDFSNSDLSGQIFIDCSFTSCDLSMAKLIGTVLTGCRFIDCKMLGLQFDTCNEYGFSPDFENCNLSNSVFFKIKMKGWHLKNLILQDTDFTECDLSNSIIENCDLKGALFENSILEKTDLRTAFNYSIDPERNRIRKARFSLSGIAGLLDKHDIEIEKQAE